MRTPGRKNFRRQYYSEDTIKLQRPHQHPSKLLCNPHLSVIINPKTRVGEAGRQKADSCIHGHPHRTITSNFCLRSGAMVDGKFLTSTLKVA